eukprot:1978564-Rhodomonas_salina.1
MRQKSYWKLDQAQNQARCGATRLGKVVHCAGFQDGGRTKCGALLSMSTCDVTRRVRGLGFGVQGSGCGVGSSAFMMWNLGRGKRRVAFASF